MYKRVLVPLDGSMVAEGVIPFIMEIAGPLDMQVVLLRVLVPVPPMVVEGTSRVTIEDVAKRRSEAEEYLVPLAAKLGDKGVRATTDVRRGEPVAEILAGARDAEADLIAMTTHGRSGLGRLLFGSVAEAVVRHAEIPVFLMRLPNDKAAARAAWQADSMTVSGRREP